MYDYFIAWREAYHSGRETYHSQMKRLYQRQLEFWETTSQLYLENLKTFYSFLVMNYMKLLPDPTKKWGLNWTDFPPGFGKT